MIKFSKFPRGQSTFYYNQDKLLLRHTREIVNFYMKFFREIGFLPLNHTYYKGKLVREVNLEKKEILESDAISKKLLAIGKIKKKETPFLQDDILPIHLRCSTVEAILLLTGVAVFEKGNNTARFILHEFSVARNLINPTPHYLQYLHKFLGQYVQNEGKQSIGKLLNHYEKNYHQFQKDCKQYFEDTFYQFYNKMRMIDCVKDILFSVLSLKEIAHKNGLTDYNGMYKIFKKYDKLPLHGIPRFSKDF